MNTKSAQFVGDIPRDYDAGLGPVLFAGPARRVAALVSGLQPGAVLELAAGTGIVSRELRDQLPDATRLVVTDLNPPMLDLAAAKFATSEKVEIEPADAMDLHYPDDSFDVVLCQFGVMFLPDKARSHSEVLRVIKPGGRYVFTTWDSLDVNEFARQVHETISTFFPGEPPGFYNVPFGYHDRDEIAALMAQCGFDEVTVTQESLVAPVSAPEAFSRGLVFGNPLYEEVIERGGDPQAVSTALEQLIRNDIGTEVKLGVVLAQGVKPAS